VKRGNRKAELENSFILGSSGEVYSAIDIRECGTEAVYRNDATEPAAVYFKSLSRKLWKGSEKNHENSVTRDSPPAGNQTWVIVKVKLSP
jgi:hypothetical protein